MRVDANGERNVPQKFHEFLDREFDLVARDASVEELAEFAFGGIDEAIKTYDERRKELHETI
jgi:hypothetical protein